MRDTSHPTEPSERELFFAALDRASPQERAVFLDEACAGNLALRRRVEGLLTEHFATGKFMQEPAAELAAAVPAAPPHTEASGTVIGRYKLLEKLGEGGFGTVYMAEQKEPFKRCVALKIVKLGMDTEQVIARFEAERQALALMDHPNIAKVLDGGTIGAPGSEFSHPQTSALNSQLHLGRPYFVMELVHGMKITDYCDQHHLSRRERLELLIKVCQAVQHAHQKGIIHRDLKPSNILVSLHDGVPVPKVIDFGVAKAMEQKLTDKTVVTQWREFIGTPCYMSPEQVELNGLDIDTRSDIYSLGVLLYELLTGTTPFDAKTLLAAGLDGMRRTIREEEPVWPSTRLTQARSAAASAGPGKSQIATRQSPIDSDLDWIVMKCLDKERARRYETANGLAMDLQRHLNHEPVVARPPSTAYRVQKFIRRNKLKASAAAAVAAALILGAVASTWLAVRAKAQELAARRSAYAAEMSLAYQALEAGNLGYARELLEKQRVQTGTDLRGWEWRHLWRQTRGQELFSLSGHSNKITAALFLNNGRLASAGGDNTLRFWDLDRRINTATIALPEGWHALALSPDGAQLAVSGGRWWAVYDASARRLVQEGTNECIVKNLAFSPDGQWLALAATYEVRLLNAHTYQPVCVVDRDVEGSFWTDQMGLGFCAGSQTMAYAQAGAHTTNRTIELTNLVTRSAATIRPKHFANCLVFTRDGRFLISGGDGGLDVWDARTGSFIRSLPAHRATVKALAVSPDGRLLVSCGMDQTIRLWDTTSWNEAGFFRGHTRGVETITFSPDGERLVSGGGDEELRVWQTRAASKPGETFRSADDAPFNWPFAAGDRVALVHGNLPYAPTDMAVAETVREALKQLGNRGAVSYLNCLTLEESQPEATPPNFSSAQLMAFGPGANSVAVGWLDGRIEIWRTRPFRRELFIAGSSNAVVHLSFSESGQQLSVHRRDDTVEIWDLDRNALKQTLPPLANLRPGPNCEFWAHDHILTRRWDAQVEVWLLPDGRRKVYTQPKGGLFLFAVSHDGRLLATSAYDPVLRIWDMEQEQTTMTTTGQFTSYDAVVFSPDDSRLVAGGGDGTITIWDIATRQQVAHWQAHKRGCVWLRFAGVDQALVSLGDVNKLDRWQGEIRVWRAPRLVEIEAAQRKP